MNEELIQKIVRYKNDCLSDLGDRPSKKRIQKQAYEQWAIDEIILSIMDHPLADSDVIIDNFILKMQYFLHSSHDIESNYIFTVAVNTAEDILGLI